MAAHNWRALRTRALDKGIADLMAVSSMHVVLDLMEQIGLESVTVDAKTKAEAMGKVRSYYDKLYKPDPTAIAVNGGEVGPPPGWSDEEVEASFDAFLSAGGG
ncbi:hypothetical protein I5G63_gp033 [Mycobacterium phage Imvubu]|uniref:Uncharacterized protein n=1 Tax=Mycobacterium phage Imvubu TaxID=2686233 RepID=A0A6B9LIU8_9CAUD|nr:hypothetical protein I5G63_gp033 [Mycobacterium phage Imvubu]QHB37774.1 hypothetical protein PBI_IMVUBU_33 [Mycobacterium phage Imvubu]